MQAFGGMKGIFDGEPYYNCYNMITQEKHKKYSDNKIEFACKNNINLIVYKCRQAWHKKGRGVVTRDCQATAKCGKKD